MNEKPIWGVHMDRSLGLSPLGQKFIAVGWDKLGDLSKLSPSREGV